VGAGQLAEMKVSVRCWQWGLKSQHRERPTYTPLLYPMANFFRTWSGATVSHRVHCGAITFLAP